ncbi:hypothetical protein ZIOFF_062857 [Zingiber officinale]|uniref:Uncharacterized protein n=1 Tax=Zingiber officinale TaxID=94328 RepID=A0A8J5F5M5_ZINOF|nr:hypothetical protein ZIOFF_062857 [Zingiber officinale]
MIPPPSSPAATPDLNLVPFPKIEPKLEPADDLHADVTAPTGPLEPFLPPPSPIFSPSPSPSPRIDPASGYDNSSLFAEYLRLAHLYASSSANHNPLSIIPAPPDPSASSPAVVSARKKRKPRSGEMVRASSMNVPDLLHFRDIVRRTRITFDSLRVFFLQEEEKGEAFEAIWGKRTRPDLKASTIMADHDLWLNRDRRIIGSIPGIGVGEIFFFRMELCVLGLHGQSQAGIDYVPASRSATGEPIATSIIVSGGYEDDEDSGLMLVYTGHGGRGPNMFKHSMDQKLEGGNLALERSMNYGIEIRVIRGIRSRHSPGGKIYVYDGLYKIVKCWMDVGKSGFGIYKYKLLRIEGQEEMGSDILKFAEELKVNPLSAKPTGYVSLDISTGTENFPVSLFNDIDDDREPSLFEYLCRPIFPAEAFQGKANADGGSGCACVSNCTVGCFCVMKNGGQFPYDSNGFLVRGKPLIYECGPSCSCPPSCPNRVSQKGVKHRLEVFRSNETGWGVRSLDLIRAGSFICEFSGIVLTSQQTEILASKGHCLVHPGQFPGRWIEWGDISDVNPEYVPPNYPIVPSLDFSIDVSRSRNVACYLSQVMDSRNLQKMCSHRELMSVSLSLPLVFVLRKQFVKLLKMIPIPYYVPDRWESKSRIVPGGYCIRRSNGYPCVVQVILTCSPGPGAEFFAVWHLCIILGVIILWINVTKLTGEGFTFTQCSKRSSQKINIFARESSILTVHKIALLATTHAMFADLFNRRLGKLLVMIIVKALEKFHPQCIIEDNSFNFISASWGLPSSAVHPVGQN